MENTQRPMTKSHEGSLKNTAIVAVLTGVLSNRYVLSVEALGF